MLKQTDGELHYLLKRPPFCLPAHHPVRRLETLRRMFQFKNSYLNRKAGQMAIPTFRAAPSTTPTIQRLFLMNVNADDQAPRLVMDKIIETMDLDLGPRIEAATSILSSHLNWILGWTSIRATWPVPDVRRLLEM